ncbi:hypothetical protein [Streptomyces sp. NBC_01022]|uniref:hypothetical protein n=1 Tax=Streptomyces sp. NBC_01022 TaxID=2903723 RepID=UPI002DD9CB78|nr:hypothetical protein [Streptomyces sp. NBC_01022]WRZ82213.1 hypothetical protein OG316_19090 [Streptomyces sp. NBC_01022]
MGMKEKSTALNMFAIELQKFDWRQMECGCGESAMHLPVKIAELVALDQDHAHGEAFTTSLHGHVLTGADGLVAASSAFLAVAMAALTEPLSEPARRETLGTILRILGSATSTEATGGPVSAFATECVDAVRQGQWLLYAEVMNGTSPAGVAYAFESLMLIEQDRKRLRAVQAAVEDRLPWDLKTEEI